MTKDEIANIIGLFQDDVLTKLDRFYYRIADTDVDRSTLQEDCYEIENEVTDILNTMGK